jgi:hypothetical protein
MQNMHRHRLRIRSAGDGSVGSNVLPVLVLVECNEDVGYRDARNNVSANQSHVHVSLGASRTARNHLFSDWSRHVWVEVKIHTLYTLTSLSRSFTLILLKTSRSVRFANSTQGAQEWGQGSTHSRHWFHAPATLHGGKAPRILDLALTLRPLYPRINQDISKWI